MNPSAMSMSRARITGLVLLLYLVSVSYTHLDVYKRQTLRIPHLSFESSLPQIAAAAVTSEAFE